MPQIRISVTLRFATPPSVGDGGTQGTLANKVVLRNAGRQFIIPASQVKGKLRHACEQLLRAGNVPLCRPPRPERMCPSVDRDPEPEDENQDAPELPMIEGAHCCELCQIFGSPGRRSTLRFHDLVATQHFLPQETFRSMVSLNRARRTAEHARLFLFETAPNFAGLEFANAEAITGYVLKTEHLHVLLAGLKMLTTWGGGASRGLGWAEGIATARLEGTEVKLKIEEVRKLWRS